MQRRVCVWQKCRADSGEVTVCDVAEAGFSGRHARSWTPHSLTRFYRENTLSVQKKLCLEIRNTTDEIYHFCNSNFSILLTRYSCSYLSWYHEQVSEPSLPRLTRLQIHFN